MNKNSLKITDVLIGSLALVVGFCTQASAQGAGKPVPLAPAPAEYSDRQLTPQSKPSAAIGNDLLLAENANDVSDADGNFYPETWSMTLNFTETYSGSGNVNPQFSCIVNWNGTAAGPTGTYDAGTIGNGKHAENTSADMQTEFKAGSRILATYQYVVTDSSYDSNGHVTVGTIYMKQVYSYTM